MRNDFGVFLSRTGRLLCLAALVACVGGGPAGSEPRTDSMVTGSVSGGSAEAAAVAISAYRATHGLGPLRVDASLNRLAATQVRAMARADTVGHNVPGGGTLAKRAKSAGVYNAHVMENAGGGERYRSFGQVFAGWRGSPGHNAAMLKPDMTRLGIATVSAPGSKHKVFWVLEMAGPRVH